MNARATKPPKPEPKLPKEPASKLLPPDWAGMELAWRTGIRSVRSIAMEFGVSGAAVHQHFTKLGIPRDLRARIQAKAQEKLNRAALTPKADVKAPPATEAAIVEVNAQVLAHVQTAHRKHIGRARELAFTMLAELEEVTGAKPILERISSEMRSLDEGEMRSALQELAMLVRNLPSRVKVMRDLAETLRTLVGMEREAFGLNTTAGSDGRPLVIIRDFTGRGDPDAPRRNAPPAEEATVVPWVSLVGDGEGEAA